MNRPHPRLDCVFLFPIAILFQETPDVWCVIFTFEFKSFGCHWWKKRQVIPWVKQIARWNWYLNSARVAFFQLKLRAAFEKPILARRVSACDRDLMSSADVFSHIIYTAHMRCNLWYPRPQDRYNKSRAPRSDYHLSVFCDAGATVASSSAFWCIMPRKKISSKGGRGS